MSKPKEVTFTWEDYQKMLVEIENGKKATRFIEKLSQIPEIDLQPSAIHWTGELQMITHGYGMNGIKVTIRGTLGQGQVERPAMGLPFL
jgi:hypothetical protein